jgi:hypothetical protein
MPDMKLPSRYIHSLTALLLVSPVLPLSAQSVSITGPNCVLAGPPYMYNISGQWQSGSTVRVCVTGGVLADSGGTCAGGAGILSFIRVSWDSGGQTSGTIAVSSSLGDTTLVVQITTSLIGGQVDGAVANQSLDTLTTPVTLTVSPASGGACQPAYVYQWQQSADNVVWENVPGASNVQFVFSGPLKQPMYYRRVVTDNAANILAYSSVAVIWVPTPMPIPPNQLNTPQ